MNSKNIILAATLIGGLFTASALSAAAAFDPAMQDGRGEFSAPVPMTVVTPVGIPRRYQNDTIRLSLTIDEQGRPHHIHILSNRDPFLVRQLMPAVAKWKFTPARRNGLPVSVDVVLPIELIETSAL